MRIKMRPASKYGNRKATCGWLTFDSEKEKQRWLELCMMERAGEIRALRRQVEFDLIPTQKGGIRTERGVKYIADFVYYTKDGARVIEDVKGFRTDVYRIKRKLMKLAGNEITEV